jgi:hypothetical protein
MPNVAGKKFPYTATGKKAAMKAAMKKKKMDPNEKVGMEYGIKSERKGLRGAMMRKAISSAAGANTPTAKKFTKGVSAGKNMVSKDKAAASRGGTMPVKKKVTVRTKKK